MTPTLFLLSAAAAVVSAGGLTWRSLRKSDSIQESLNTETAKVLHTLPNGNLTSVADSEDEITQPFNFKIS